LKITGISIFKKKGSVDVQGSAAGTIDTAEQLGAQNQIS